jgi:hypothetical protein
MTGQVQFYEPISTKGFDQSTNATPMKEIQEVKGQAIGGSQNTNEQLLDTLMKNIMMQE